MRAKDTNTNTLGEYVLLIVFILGACFSTYKLVNNTNYSKPWWTGTASQNICLVGTACYTLDVFSNGESIGNVYFSNGGYISPDGDTICQKDPIFSEICTFQDSQGRDWQIRKN